MLLLIFSIMFLIYSVFIIIYEKRSVRSKLIEKAMKISNYKKISEKKLEEEIRIRQKEGMKEYKIPLITISTSILKEKYKDMDYYIINDKSTGNIIFYLHGGSFFDNPLIFHFEYLDKLAKIGNFKIIMPIYPKTPCSNCEKTINIIYDFYLKIIGNGKATIMGDSAGGNLALVLSILLRDRNNIIPENIIMFSPWLDLTLKNRDLEKYKISDPQLSLKNLKLMADLWASSLDKTNYLASPIYGDLSNLKNITIFTGTHELLYPDAVKLKEKCKKEKIKLNYYKYEKMNHVFILEPIPEAKNATDKIIKIINKI